VVFIWGSRKRVVEDAVTLSNSLECPMCPYRGHMLLYREQSQAHVYWIPASRWKGKAGAMVCPRCGNSQFLKKKEYKTTGQISSESGVLLSDAHMRITETLEVMQMGRTPSAPEQQIESSVGQQCSNCGNSMSVGSVFCSSCGSKSAKHCTNCGSKTAPNDKFCGSCGKKAG
jgi:uncharacterized OB-fold protein